MTRHRPISPDPAGFFDALPEREGGDNPLNQAMTTIVIGLDPAGQVNSWNEGARRIVGYEPVEMLGVPVERLFTEEARRRRYPETLLQTARRQGAAHSEGWRVRKDGSHVWTAGETIAIGPHDNPQGFVKILQHCPDHQNVRDERDRLADRLGRILALADAGLILLDWHPDDAAEDVASRRPRLFGRARALLGLFPEARPSCAELDAMVQIKGGDDEGSSPLVAPGEAIFTLKVAGAHGHVLIRRAEFVAEERMLVCVVRSFRGRSDHDEEHGFEADAFQSILPFLLWRATPDGLFDWLSPEQAVARFPHIAPMAGDRWMEAIHPDDLPNVVHQWRQAVSEKRGLDLRMRFRGPDGRYRWSIVRGSALIADDGQPYWVGYYQAMPENPAQDRGSSAPLATDETSPKLIRATGTGAERMGATETGELDLVRTPAWILSEAGMAMIDFEGQLLGFNPRWGAILGWSRGETYGQALLDHVATEDRRALAALLDVLRREGPDHSGIHHLGLTLKHRSGVLIAASCSAMRWQDYCCLAMRVEDQVSGGNLPSIRKDDLARRDAMIHAERLEALGRLSGGIVHDFNNMLNASMGALDMLDRRIEQQRYSALGRYSAIVRDSTQRAAALASRLLAFARRQRALASCVDPNLVISGMRDLLIRVIGQGVMIEYTLDPATDPVECDPGQLENAVLNLAINARDAMPDGGQLTIETRNLNYENAALQAMPPGAYVAISVADTGPGIPADIAGRIFEPFFTTKAAGVGTGLGLAMVQRFVRDFGGRVELETAPGRGARFTMILPVAQLQGPGA